MTFILETQLTMSVMSGSSGLGSFSKRSIDVSTVLMFSDGFHAPWQQKTVEVSIVLMFSDRFHTP